MLFNGTKNCAHSCVSFNYHRTQTKDERTNVPTAILLPHSPPLPCRVPKRHFSSHRRTVNVSNSSKWWEIKYAFGSLHIIKGNRQLWGEILQIGICLAAIFWLTLYQKLLCTGIYIYIWSVHFFWNHPFYPQITMFRGTNISFFAENNIHFLLHKQ